MHINETVRKAHQHANATLRCFTTRDNVLLVNAFKTYVRPIVEYNCVIWFPHLKHDIEHIEKVQRTFTKRLVGMKTLSYTERINKLCLPTLELRHLHIDLLYCYKILFGRVDLCCEDFFNVCVSSVMRGHKYKLHKQSCNKSVCSQFFL